MHNFKTSEHLNEILKKLAKKDKNIYEQLTKKIKEIIHSSDIEHYKNLKHNMKDSKRVHIGHFVLVFQFDKFTDMIKFEDFDHHDNIYRR